MTFKLRYKAHTLLLFAAIDFTFEWRIDFSYTSFSIKLNFFEFIFIKLICRRHCDNAIYYGLRITAQYRFSNVQDEDSGSNIYRIDKLRVCIDNVHVEMTFFFIHK